MTLKFLDHQVTRYKVVSFTIRVNINGGADLGEMRFFLEHMEFGIPVEHSSGDVKKQFITGA